LWLRLAPHCQYLLSYHQHFGLGVAAAWRTFSVNDWEWRIAFLFRQVEQA
jgi:hypothetical protein